MLVIDARIRTNHPSEQRNCRGAPRCAPFADELPIRAGLAGRGSLLQHACPTLNPLRQGAKAACRAPATAGNNDQSKACRGLRIRLSCHDYKRPG
jgi:hypothetical protein